MKPLNLTLRLDKELSALLQRDAAENERTMSGSVRAILRRHFAARTAPDKDDLAQRIAKVRA
jgi:plasmid stability protein